METYSGRNMAVAFRLGSCIVADKDAGFSTVTAVGGTKNNGQERQIST